MAKKKQTNDEAVPVAETVEETLPTTGEEQGQEDAVAETDAADAAEMEERRLERIGDGGTGEHAPQPTSQIVLEIDPENVLIDPDLRALRLWSGKSQQEASLMELARTMHEEGQTEPVGMYQAEDGSGFVLYDGHRRREAAVIIREEWDATFMLRALINPDMTKEQAIRAAMLADSQHEKFTAAELARNIGFLRKQFNWTSGEHTADVAGFLGVSPATITQMERFAKAVAKSPELAAKVEQGLMTVTAALDLIAATSKVPEVDKGDVQAAVVGRAQELANAEAGKKPGKREPLTKAQKEAAKHVADAAKKDRAARLKREAEAKERGETLPSEPEPKPEDAQQETEPSLDPDTTYGAPEPEPAPPSPISGKHVRQAARQILPEVKLKAPKMSEAVELIEQWAGPAYPDVMSKFAGTFADWGRGKKSNKVLEAAWDDVADALAKKKGKEGKGEGKAVPPSKPTKPAKTDVKPTVKKAVGAKKASPAAKPDAKPKKTTPPSKPTKPVKPAPTPPAKKKSKK